MSHTLKLILWIGALLLVMVALGLAFPWFTAAPSAPTPTTTATISSSSDTTTLMKLIAARESGDYNAAIAYNQSIQTDVNATADEKAQATIAVAGSEFHLTGNINDRLQDVQNLKQVVLGQGISSSTRANAINVLASTYSDAGNDQAIFNAIFAGAPFNLYLTSGNNAESIRSLYVWSYQVSPTPESAVHLAKLYSDPHPNLSPSEIASDNQKAEDYLAKAAAAALQRERIDPTYLSSSSYYVNYQFWGSVAIGRLAREGIAPYTTEYQGQFDQYIGYVENTPNDVQAKENLYYARYYYAATLFEMGQKAKAEEQLDDLAQELSALPNPNTTAFVLFVRNTYASQPNKNWSTIAELLPVSAAFKSEINKLIATTTSS